MPAPDLPTDFAEAFVANRPRLAAFLTNRIDPALRQRVSADDILSETFRLGTQKWDAYRDDPKLTLYGWFYRLAKDCLIAAHRRESRGMRDYGRDEPIPEESSMQMGLRLVSREHSPSSEAVRNEMGARVLQFLGLLKSEDRDVLHLRYLDGLSFAEIGEQLDLTENAASVRCFRAVKQLKTLFGSESK